MPTEVISALFVQHSTPLPIPVLINQDLLFIILSDFYNLFTTLFGYDAGLNQCLRKDLKA